MTNREKIIQNCYFTINDLSVVSLVSGIALFNNLRESLKSVLDTIMRMESIEDEEEEIIYSYPLFILIKGFRYFFDIKTIKYETVNNIEELALKIASDWRGYNDIINYKKSVDEVLQPIFKASEIEEIELNLDLKDDNLRKYTIDLNKKDRFKLADRYLEYNELITVEYIRKERLDFLNEAIEYYNNSDKIIDESLSESNRLKDLNAISQEEYQMRIINICRDKIIVNNKLVKLTKDKVRTEIWLKRVRND